MIDPVWSVAVMFPGPPDDRQTRLVELAREHQGRLVSGASGGWATLSFQFERKARAFTAAASTRWPDARLVTGKTRSRSVDAVDNPN